MIKDYINQDATWSRKTGDNGYGEPIYAEAVPIKVRWEDCRKLVRNSKGLEVVSMSQVICIEAVQENDRLTFDGRNYTVIAAPPMPGLDGTISHREVAV